MHHVPRVAEDANKNDGENVSGLHRPLRSPNRTNKEPYNNLEEASVHSQRMQHSTGYLQCYFQPIRECHEVSMAPIR